MTKLDKLLLDFDGSPAAYSGLARRLNAEHFSLQPLRVAILATFTADLLRPYIIVEAARRGFAVDLLIGPYGQLEQQVFDPDSALYKFSPDVVLVVPAAEDVAMPLCDRFLSLDAGAVNAEIDAVESRMRALVQESRRRIPATIFLSNFAPRSSWAAGIADAALPLSQADVFRDLNRRMGAICRETNGAYIFDLEGLVGEVGRKAWTDFRFLYFARSPHSTTAQRAFAERLARYLSALISKPRKCLVLDLDNTLWGGVLGEDGIDGVKLGEDWPGNAFKAFHRACLSLRDRGVLLAVCSKNDESHAVKMLNEHADCLIRAEHLSCYRIGWGDKATALREIAADLNIGIDALVFFDDNPVEREWVRQNCPEVYVIEVPKDPQNYVSALYDSGAFDQLTLTADDRRRAEMYAAEVQRKKLVQSATSLEGFLRQLDMKVVLGSIGAEALPRVSQLIAKTNQFNLTGRRHRAAELGAFLDAGAIGLWTRVSDRFGDSGLVGVALAVPEDEGDWRLDIFLLSCRVIGRQVENLLLTILAEKIRARGGCRIIGEYIATERNGMAENFLAEAGFSRDHDGRWYLDIRNELPKRPDHVMIELVEQ